MSDAVPACPRCQTPMTPGALRTTTRSSLVDPFAVAGSNRVRWVGDDGERYRIQAYRCPSCGSIELSATEWLESSGSGCFGVLLAFVGVTAFGFAVCRCLTG